MDMIIDVAEIGHGGGMRVGGVITSGGQAVAGTDVTPRLQWNRLGGRWVIWVGEASGKGATVMVAARRLARELGATTGTITVRRHYGTGTRERCERIERAAA
jgi:hypothetical protein